jgi:uncharacterized membrane protein YfhO
VKIETHTANRRVMEVNSSAPGWLVFRQSYHPGWHAYVNGHEVPIRHANYSAMALRLESTPAKIELVFRSPAWTLGLSLFLLGCLGALAVFTWPRGKSLFPKCTQT